MTLGTAAELVMEAAPVPVAVSGAEPSRFGASGLPAGRAHQLEELLPQDMDTGVTRPEMARLTSNFAELLQQAQLRDGNEALEELKRVSETPTFRMALQLEAMKNNPDFSEWSKKFTAYTETALKIIETHEEVQNALSSEQNTQQMIDRIRARFNEQYQDGAPPADSPGHAVYEKKKEMVDKLDHMSHGEHHSLLGEIFHYFISEMKGVSQL